MKPGEHFPHILDPVSMRKVGYDHRLIIFKITYKSGRNWNIFTVGYDTSIKASGKLVMVRACATRIPKDRWV